MAIHDAELLNALPYPALDLVHTTEDPVGPHAEVAGLTSAAAPK
ncbi:hypothetical protein [Streptomyces sp. NPDC058308]